jgi:lipoprotein-releasing system permease protein
MRIKDLVTTEFPEIDSKLIYYEMRPALRRFETLSGRVSGLEVRLKNAGDVGSVQQALSLQYPDMPLAFESWTDRNRALFMALRLEKFAMTTFLFLSVLITCFSPITLLAMLISQKRKEIGLLMALGYSRQNVQRLFFRIGTLLAGTGLFLGVAAGVLLSWLLQKFPVEILPDIYYDTILPSVINWGTVLWVAVFCSVVAVLAAFVPAYRSVLRDPSDNLRRQTGT